MLSKTKAILIAILGVVSLASIGRGQGAELPKNTSDLFVITQIWNIHLIFTSEQWKAIEPEGGGFFGGPPMRRGPGDGPGGPPKRGPGFGPAMFLAPTFLKAGDANGDGKLSRPEFEKISEKWFGDWDKEKSGKINADQLRAGLNSTIVPPNFGGGPGPGRGGGGMNLQGPEGKRNGVAAAAGIDFKYVHADVEFEGHRFKDAAVRYKGNGTFMESRSSQKKSFKIDLNEFVKGESLAGVTKLNLHNNVTDGAWMNEVLAHRLYRDAGVPAPRTAYAKVFVTVPGKYDHEYFGLYSLVENVDKDFIHHVVKSKKGALFKPVTPDLFADLGDEWKKYKQTYDPKMDVSSAEKQRLIELCKLVSHSTDEEFAKRFGDYIEVDEFARYMAVMVFLSDLDGILGPGQNFYLYLKPDTQKFMFISWDQDHSFGQFPMRGTQEQRENLSIQKPWQGRNPFLERVYKLDAFQKEYRAALEKFSNSIFQPERFEKQVDEIAEVIRPAVQAESAEKLEQFDKNVSGENITPSFGGFRPPDEGNRDGRPNGPRFGGFGQAVKPIKPFVKIRSQSIKDQLSGKLEGQTAGGFGFPGGGPPGQDGPGRPGGAGGGFGPGMFLGGAFMNALDENKDGFISKEEFAQTFSKWFQEWNDDHSGFLTEDQLRTGINNDLSPYRGGPPEGFPPK